MKKVIRDPIHKDIFLTEAEVRLVDTSIFQRLRRIKQLGVTNLVYPSANHTRFEHSIGAAHIAGRIAKRLDLGERAEPLEIAALLHDLGHGPLSHTSEELLKRYLGSSHEDATLKLIRESEIHEVLTEYGIDTDVVIDILSKKDRLSGLVSGEVDVDRMDYLVRDAYHTGVAYGIIDLDRVVNTVGVVDDRVVINKGGLRAVEGLLVARFLMTPTVYLHHASRIADAMFLRATERAIVEGVLNLKEFFSMDDIDVQSLFRQATGYVKELGSRLDERRLYKIAWFKDESITEDVKVGLLHLMKDLKRWSTVEEELAEDCGLEPGFVIVDIPPKEEYEESKALVYDGSQTLRLEDVSPIVKILLDTQASRWSVGVYTPEEHVEKVGKVCENIGDYLK